MLFASALLLSTLTLLAHAQHTTTTDDSLPAAAAATTTSPAITIPGITLPPINWPTSVIDSLENYISSVTAQPEFVSFYQAITSAIPASDYDSIEQNAQVEHEPPDYLDSVLPFGAEPSWISAVPTSYLSYLSSIRAVENSIIAEESIGSKGSEGPAPTQGPRVKIVGAGVAVGAAGLAMISLVKFWG